MRIDLHTHTTASDGLLVRRTWSPRAAARGVGLLAVSDHDSTACVDAAIVPGGGAGYGGLAGRRAVLRC